MTLTAASHLRFVFAGLLLLAVLVRGLIPAGFMPGMMADETGVQKHVIVICTSTGMQTVEIDGDAPDGHDGNHKGDMTCPYAPVLAQNIPLPSPVVLPPDFSARSIAFTPGHLAALQSYRHSYTAQAPPASFLI